MLTMTKPAAQQTCTECYETIPETELTYSTSLGNIPGAPYHQNCLEKVNNSQAKRGEILTQKNETNNEKEKHFREELIMALVQKKRGKATELLTKHITRDNHIYTTRDDDHPEMWIYHDGIYQPNGKTYVREIIRSYTGNLFTTQLINEVIRKIETDTYVDQDEFLTRDTKYPQLIPVQNGILNINTLELDPYTPRKFFFTKIPVEYHKDSTCPKIEAFINDITFTDDQPLLQEYAGFLLLREYKYEKSLMLTGTGRNGKGKFLQLLTKLIGHDNCSNISLQDIEKDQFALGALHGKLANIAGDISKEALKNTGNFKALVGRDTIQANRKFKTRIQFENYAKMLFSANTIPRTTDMSDAFFNRWLLVTFPYKFLPKKEIEMLPEGERERVKEQNPEILEHITSPQEMQGFLTWCLTGYQRLRKNKSFTTSHTSQTVKEMWIRKSDSFMAFCMDRIEEHWDGQIEKAELRKEYHLYCREHKLVGVSDVVIKRVLAEQFGASDTKSDARHFWVGIRFGDFVDGPPVGGSTRNGQGSQGGHGNPPLGKHEKAVVTTKPLPSLATLPETNPEKDEIPEPHDEPQTYKETGIRNDEKTKKKNPEMD